MMLKKLKFILGSTSYLKVQALRDACNQCNLPDDIESIPAQSGQNAQPYGFDETYKGALARATEAKNTEEKNVVGVGIENGIFSINYPEPHTLDLAIIILLLDGGRQIVTSSAGIIFPEQYVLEAKKLGFATTTVGSVITRHLGGDPGDPHSTLTKFRLGRQKILTDALVAALCQIH